VNNLYGVQLGSLCSGLLRVVVRCKVLAVCCGVLQCAAVDLEIGYG